MSEPKPLPCDEKLVFDSEKQAVAVATTLKYQRSTKLKAYLCPNCKLWHLASHY
jgi:hypothetical protein